eukprot:scaffold83597_cov34-Prasinocladus_malaysianus.AAC.1
MLSLYSVVMEERVGPIIVLPAPASQKEPSPANYGCTEQSLAKRHRTTPKNIGRMFPINTHNTELIIYVDVLNSYEGVASKYTLQDSIKYEWRTNAYYSFIVKI